MRGRPRRHSIDARDGLMPWITTFNDMITLLTVFFMMIFAMSAIDARIGKIIGEGLRQGLGVLYEGRRAGVKVVGPDRPESRGAESQQQPAGTAVEDPAAGPPAPSAAQSVQALADQEGLTVTMTASGLLLTLEDKLLFDSGRAEIREKGRAALDRIAAVLATVSGAVRVEGHTDDTPIQTRTFPSNWELSMARAVNVVKYLAAEGSIARQRLSAVGYADSKPVAANTDTAGRARNRRVEIVVELNALVPPGAGPSSSQGSEQLR